MPREAPTLEVLEHQALRNALYHTARRQWLDFVRRLTTLLVLFAGAGTVSQVVNGFPIIAATLGLVVTLLSATQLVFDFAGRARDHLLLQRRYYDILGKVQEGGDLSAKHRCAIMAELTRVAGDEPPTLRALDAIAYNEATDALYGEARHEYRIPITRWQSLTRHLLPHNGAAFDRQAFIPRAGDQPPTTPTSEA